MSEILPTITIEIDNLVDGFYPLRLLSLDGTELAQESISYDSFDRTQWQDDPVSLMLGTDRSTAFKEIGTKLFSIIHKGRVGAVWDEFIKANPTCRVQLFLKPSEIFAFPWELVCKDNMKRPSTNSEQTFLRVYQTDSAELPNESSLLPLRILIVIGANQDDLAVLAQEEILEIEASIRNNNATNLDYNLAHRLIDIEKVWNPTIKSLGEKYKEFKPHIFHFIGHGEVESGNASLIIDSLIGQDEYETITWQYDSIFADFDDWGWLPRLVVINSCRTETKGGIPSEELQQHIWSIGEVFRELGVPAIIAMQADISGKGAGVFSGVLYQHLAEFDTLDKAVGHARVALQSLVGGFENREWAIPVLTIGQPPERILPFNLIIDNTKLVEIKDCCDLREVRYFSSRVEKRRELLKNLYPPTNKLLKDLIIVKGKESSGKSWITKVCLEILTLLNFDVRYVPVGGEKTIDWLDFLLQIRDGNNFTPDPSIPKPFSAVRKELKKEAFYPFNWGLIKRTNSSEPPEWDGNPITAQKADLGEKSTATQDFIEKTFSSFRRSLLDSAEFNKPLVIVLDGFPKDGGFFQTQMADIIKYLITPVANGYLKEVNKEGEIRCVKFILVLRDDEFDNYKLADLAGKYADFPVKYFSLEELKSCLNEYARYMDPQISEEDIQIYLKYADRKYRNIGEISPSLVKEIV